MMQRQSNYGKWIFIGVHVLLLLVGLLVFLFVSAEMDKAAGENVFFVYPKTASAPAFTSNDLDAVQEALRKRSIDASGQSVGQAYAISFEAASMKVIENASAQVYSRVIATNHAYAAMHRLAFAEGAFFGELSATRVAVLSEALAWRLLGVTDAVGREVTIDGEAYTIVGVVTQGAGGYSKDADDYTGADVYYAYVPLDDAALNTAATNVYVQSQDYRWLDDVENITAALRAVNRNAAEYGVCDLNGYVEIANNRSSLLLALVSAGLLFSLAWRILREAKRLASDEQKTAVRNMFVMALVAIPPMVFIGMGIGALPHVTDGSLLKIVMAIFNHDALPGAAYVTGAVARLRSLNAISAAAFAVCLAVTGELFLFVCCELSRRREM